jgi:hypothetical protein
MEAVGDGQNLHIVTLGGQFVKKILNRGNHTVGVGGI